MQAVIDTINDKIMEIKLHLSFAKQYGFKDSEKYAKTSLKEHRKALKILKIKNK